MNEPTFSECLRARRSVRHFTDDEVSVETIRELIELASWAPSGGNDQPWEVTAVSPSRARSIRETYERRVWRALAPKMAMVVEQIEGGCKFAEEAVPRVLSKIDAGGMSRGAPWLLLVHQRPAKVDEARVAEFHGVLRSRFSDNDVPTLSEMTSMCGVVNEEVGFASVMCFVYAFALAAESRGLASCIQHSWMVFREEIARSLGISPLGAPIRSALLVGVPDRVSAANLKAANDASRRTVNVLFR